jgi:hypothetical protein
MIWPQANLIAHPHAATILDRLHRTFPITRGFAIKKYEHTVLDNLMLTILKPHSGAPPDIFDESIPRGTQFAGAEVHPCGRREAGTPWFHNLVQSYVHYSFCVEAHVLLTLSFKLAVTHIEFVRPRHAM